MSDTRLLQHVVVMRRPVNDSDSGFEKLFRDLLVVLDDHERNLTGFEVVDDSGPRASKPADDAVIFQAFDRLVQSAPPYIAGEGTVEEERSQYRSAVGQKSDTQHDENRSEDLSDRAQRMDLAEPDRRQCDDGHVEGLVQRPALDDGVADRPERDDGPRAGENLQKPPESPALRVLQLGQRFPFCPTNQSMRSEKRTLKLVNEP